MNFFSKFSIIIFLLIFFSSHLVDWAFLWFPHVSVVSKWKNESYSANIMQWSCTACREVGAGSFRIDVWSPRQWGRGGRWTHRAHWAARWPYSSMFCEMSCKIKMNPWTDHCDLRVAVQEAAERDPSLSPSEAICWMTPEIGNSEIWQIVYVKQAYVVIFGHWLHIKLSV